MGLRRRHEQERRLTSDANYSVSDVTVSRDGKWIGLRACRRVGTSAATGAERLSDLHLLNVASGAIERLTKNDIISEGGSPSPDNKLVAILAPDDFKFMQRGTMRFDQRLPWKKIGALRR